MNISDEAIAAAQRSVIDAMIEHGPDGHIDGYEEITRAALEAAAPYIMAQAWDEAIAAAAERQERIEYQMQAPDESVDDAPLVNPYRSAGASDDV